jgi:LuxR family maltose regulon positive regulatory protein
MGSLREYRDHLLAGFERTSIERATPAERSRQDELVEQLSERELEILRLIAIGFPNAKIAQQLYLTKNTVRAHASHIFGKLGVHSRTEATARARELGLI